MRHFVKKDEDLRAAAIEVYKFGTRMDGEYKKLVTDHVELVTKYNTILSQANAALAQANARLARQQQIAAAFAIYNSMPRYTPVPLPPPPNFTIPTINCTSNQIGTYTYTTCR